MLLVPILVYVYVLNSHETQDKFDNYSGELRVILGASHARDAVDVEKMEGYYNFGTTFQSLKESNLILTSVLPKEVDEIILFISPFSLRRTNQEPSLTYQYYFYQVNYSNPVLAFFLDKTRKEKVFSPLLEYLNSSEVRTMDWDKNAELKKSQFEGISENKFYGRPYFDDLVNHCINRGIKLSVVVSPYTPEYKMILQDEMWEADKAYIEDLLIGSDFVFRSFENEFDQRDYKNLFQDVDHLNSKGSALFTMELSRWLLGKEDR